jgi:hypothetical protein
MVAYLPTTEQIEHSSDSDDRGRTLLSCALLLRITLVNIFTRHLLFVSLLYIKMFTHLVALY